MLGVTLPNDVESWTFSEIRAFLILKSAGFKLIIKAHQRKYGLDKIPPERREMEILRLSSSGCMEDLSNISKLLSINPDFVENAVIHEYQHEDENYSFLRGVSLPFFIATSVSPLTSGFYIKIDPETTQEVVVNTYKDIKKAYTYLKKKFPEQYKGKISNHYKTPKDLKLNLSVFLLTEETIYKAITYVNYSDIEESRNFLDEAIKFVVEESDMRPTTVRGIFVRTRRMFAIPTLQRFLYYASNLT